MKTLNQEHLSSPSQVWKEWLYQLNFLQLIYDEELRLHVGFGYYLGAPIEKDLWRVNRWSMGDIDAGTNLINDYQNLIKDIDPKFHLSELDKNRDIISIPYSVDNKVLYLTTDIIRMQVEVSNLSKLNVLNEIDSILEIGGGYGQLCIGLFNARVCKKYYILDFPDVLNIVERWISSLDLEIDLYNHTGADCIDHKLNLQGIHLIPNTMLTQLTNPFSVDLVINMNSFFEMTEEQVSSYISRKYIDYKLLYSSNRDRQIQNNELNSLTTLFKQYGVLWPNYELLPDNLKANLKKKVYLLHPGKDYPFPILDFVNLHGIFGKEMQALR